jgi:hypothetical protein
MESVLYLKATILCPILYYIYTTILYLFFFCCCWFFGFFYHSQTQYVEESVVSENDIYERGWDEKGEMKKACVESV